MFGFLNELAKRKYYFIFHALFLGIIFTISMLIGTIRTFNDTNYDKFLLEYNRDVGCEVVDLEMVCSGNYYTFDNVTIDLNRDGTGAIITEGVLITKDRIASNGFNMTIKEFFEDQRCPRARLEDPYSSKTQRLLCLPLR